MRIDGGYDDGYRLCPCFWGLQPARMLLEFSTMIRSFEGLKVLDIGTGEGKNAAFCATRGAHVEAIDVSGLAIRRAQSLWKDVDNIRWHIGDIMDVNFPGPQFDLVIAYGLFHCLPTENDVHQVVRKLQKATTVGGHHVVCAMNDRSQELEAHPGLDPCLISHERYLYFYSEWLVLSQSDSDLTEVHPHNNVKHKHSMTRFIARRIV